MRLAVLAASNFTDPEHERLIWLAAGGLVLLGVLLLVATILWWRGTKGEHAALAPLELMGDRSFTAMTPVEQHRRLDAVRLQLDGDVEPSNVVAADAIDLDEALRAFQPGFDDLRDDAPGSALAADPADAAGREVRPPRLAVSVVAGPEVVDRAVPEEPPAAADPVAAGTADAEQPDADAREDAPTTETGEAEAASEEPPSEPAPRGRNRNVLRVDPLLAGEPAER